ncbi:MAG: ABC transporter ATP-binding protein [Alphaproteobacteria bacterium]|nr:ABC transporter ATP-binding protein [Alphaproteobacteria bacterium]
MTAPLIELDGVAKRYGATVALDRLSLRLDADRAPIVAVAGESGSGKTTLASLLLGFVEPSEGEIRYGGAPLARLDAAARRAYRREVQAVFQDPFAVYNPFYRVDHALTEPLTLFGLARSTTEAKAMLEAACERVGLHPEDTLGRFPHQLSGGQRQRLMVARAMMLKPRLLVADEPVSMIDASLRALVLGSLRTLNREQGVPIVYITHDLTTAYHIADIVLILYRGRLVEAGTAQAVIESPQHPYTRLLVGSIPWPDLAIRWGRDEPILKEDESARSSGCVFRGRCPQARDACGRSEPPLYSSEGGRMVRCVLHAEGGDMFDMTRLSGRLGLAADMREGGSAS